MSSIRTIIAAHTVALATLTLAILTGGIVRADVFVTSDQTIDYDLSSDRVFVGKDESTFDTLPGTITLTVNEGSNIRGSSSTYPDGNTYRGLNIFGENRANITGGKGSYISGFDQSEINITGGIFAVVDGYGTTTLSVSGGLMNTGASHDNGRINVDGGEVRHIEAWGNSTANVSGGTADTAYAFDFGVINISGGSFGSATTEGQGKANISGGEFGEVVAGDLGTANITGGNIDRLIGAGYGVVNLYGGTLGSGDILLMDNSIFNIYGTDLGLTWIGVDSDGFGDYTTYSLSGTLQGGQSLDGIVLRDYDGGYQVNGSGNPINFVTVPEASAATLFCFTCPILGLICVIRHRKQSPWKKSITVLVV